jgi:uncharacterized membrane protein YbhN (UPF0104 family)
LARPDSRATIALTSGVWPLRFVPHARGLGFACLALFTLYGLCEFASGDMQHALATWRASLCFIPAVVLLSAADVACEGAAWMWVCARLGISAANAQGVTACLATRAGLLLPAHLGRLLRPDALARAGCAPLELSLKAEAATFALDALSVVVLLVAIAAGRTHPLVGLLSAAAAIAVALGAGHRLADLVAGTRFELPRDFWWHPHTVGIVLLELCGWVAHGVALWLLIGGLAGSVGLPETTFFAAASAVVGTGTGLPGGVGPIEGLLGASLAWLRVPPEQLVFVVGGFRLATFWIWLPVGWVALVRIRRWRAPDHVPVAGAAAPSGGG